MPRLNASQKAALNLMIHQREPDKDIAAALNISDRQVRSYKRIFQMTGSPFQESRSRTNATVLAPWAVDKLIELLAEKPDYFLDEMQWFLVVECQVFVNTTTISRHLKAVNWTKKSLSLRASQQSQILRDDWRRKVMLFPASWFVFCDESGTDKRDGARRTGWSPKGVKPWMASALTRGQRFHLLPAITVDGLMHVLVYEGHTYKEGFIAWLKQEIFPRMMPFPGPNSILVMDNASWHHDPRIHHMAREAGILIWYLPPYSPDYNPIEAFFSDLKRHIRRHYRDHGGDDQTNQEFETFLETACKTIGSRVNAIQGHYRHAHLWFEEEGDEPRDYSAETAEFKATGTII